MKRPFAVMLLVLAGSLAFAQGPESGKDWTLQYQVLIRAVTPQGNFHSAIYYTPKEWADVKAEDIDAAVAKRVQDWVHVVSNPPKPVAPTKEELLELWKSRAADLDALAVQITASGLMAKSDYEAMKTDLEAPGGKLDTEIAK